MTNRFCVLKCDNNCDNCGYGKILDEAYQQGRVDAEAKWKDLPNEYADRLAEQSYQRGRRDAIDAFRNECESVSYRPIGYEYYVVVNMRDVRKIADLMKGEAE